MEKRKW